MSLRLFDLTDRVALITGSSRGIGRALAKGLGEAGARVIVNARTDQAAQAAAAELKAVLLQALDSGKTVRVSLEAATYLDVTAIELLWAAEREAIKRGVGFTLAEPAPEGVLRRAP